MATKNRAEFCVIEIENFLREPEINLNVISFGEYFRLIKALRQHRSQMLWFRYLYSFTSRYMFINTLRSLNTEILT